MNGGAAATAALACAVLGCEARAQDAEVLPATPAQSPVPVAVPTGWAPLPEVAEAGRAAATKAARTQATVVRAWGEASLGCFATVVDVTGARDEPAAKVAETFRTALAADTQVDSWTFTEGPVAEMTASVVRGTQRGSVRGRIVIDPTGVPHGAFAACFYNEREPARCQTACTALLASLESPKVSS
jgi:hypothetical protein